MLSRSHVITRTAKIDDKDWRAYRQRSELASKAAVHAKSQQRRQADNGRTTIIGEVSLGNSQERKMVEQCNNQRG